jgi:hypothetical protein
VVIAPPAIIEELAKAGKLDGSARALWRRQENRTGASTRYHRPLDRGSLAPKGHVPIAPIAQ